MTVDDVWNGFFIYSLLLDYVERGAILQLGHKAPSQARRLQPVLRARNLRMRGTGQEHWNHACDLCSWVCTNEEGIECKRLSSVYSTNIILLCSSGCLRSVVIDGINMGCPCCGVHDCDNALDSVRDHFCSQHHSLSQECAVISCSQAKQRGFRTCPLAKHRKLELHYYERGKAMFQLKTCLERLKISQTHDSLPIPSPFTDQPRLFAQDELTVTVADLQPGEDTEPGNEVDDPLEGSGDADDHMLLDAEGNLCDGKPDTGNRKLHDQFGRRQSHNEELCVASCGIIYGRQRFYGSEAPNGVRVCSFIVILCNLCVYYLTDICNVPLPDKKITSWSNLA